jgi:serine phosphatase RsbU (regulator of sigma subunit)
VIRGFSLGHALLETLVVAGPAFFATMSGLPRRARMVASAGGLLSASAVLVHLSGGLIEMHFHFFVMVAVVALYQDWIPFLASFVYVLIHHGVMGALDPPSVFNHPAAISHPWTWAFIHAFFIAGISATLLIHWTLNETYLTQLKNAEGQARREAQTVASLNEISKSLVADFEVSHVVQKVTDAATQLTSAQFGAFFYNLEDASGDFSKLYTLSGAQQEAFARLPMPRNTALFEPTFAGQEIVRLEDVTEDPRYGKNAPKYGMPKGHPPVRSYMAVPVVSRGKVLGGLLFGHEQPGRFTDEDERLAVGIAAHAAAAIEVATLFESERRVRQRTSILAEASHVLGKSLDLDRILEEFARLVVPTLADSFVADVVQSDGSLRRVALVGDERFVDAVPDRVAPPDMENIANPIVRAVLSGQSELIENVSEILLDSTITEPAYREFVRRLASRSVAVVPLVTRRHVVGVFWMGTVRASGRRLGSDDLQLAEDLARRAAVAVENTTLYSQQRTAAQTLQHALLPEELPDVPGLSIAARYVPGGPGIEVGGDWYDAVTLQDGSVALAMGDVVGHGIGAASLMGQLKSALRVYSLGGYKPAEVLRRLNNMLHEFGPGDKMATLVYGRFDPSTGVLCFASAGHPPPLVVSPDGTARFLEETSGIPLGALDRARYTEAVVAVPPGSTIVLYTDGLVETRTMPLDEGMARLRTAAEAWNTSDLDVLCDEMLKCAPDAAEESDDVAILALRWHSLGDVLRLKLPARPSVLRPLRAALRRWLQDAGASEQEMFEILTATGEAVTNVIRHASRAESANFEMEAERNESIRLIIRDHGRWREPAETRLGGQGLVIMTQFMDSVDVEREPTGTAVTMRRRLASSIRTSR